MRRARARRRVVDQVAHAAERLATSRILRGAVQAGITAVNGKPSRRANQASEIAVLPEEASTTGWPPAVRPLHNAYRNSERARRCLRLPVGCDARP
jgi:hypothetical protein